MRSDELNGEENLKALAKRVETAIGGNLFVLFLSPPQGPTAYASNARREDVHRALKQWVTAKSAPRLMLADDPAAEGTLSLSEALRAVVTGIRDAGCDVMIHVFAEGRTHVISTRSDVRACTARWIEAQESVS